MMSLLTKIDNNINYHALNELARLLSCSKASTIFQGEQVKAQYVGFTLALSLNFDLIDFNEVESGMLNFIRRLASRLNEKTLIDGECLINSFIFACTARRRVLYSDPRPEEFAQLFKTRERFEGDDTDGSISAYLKPLDAALFSIILNRNFTSLCFDCRGQ